MNISKLPPVLAEAAFEVIREKMAQGVALRTRVVTNSMAPLLRPGDWVRVEPVSPAALRPGDLAALRRGAEILVHRVHRVFEENGLRELETRSEKALVCDPPQPFEKVLGQVSVIERGARTINLHSGAGVLFDKACRVRGAAARFAARFKEGLRCRAIACGGHGAAALLFRAYYRAAAAAVSRLLLLNPGARGVWLRCSFAAGGWVPGRSDLDFGAALAAPSFEQERDLFRRLVGRYEAARKLLFIPGELDIFSEADLPSFTRYASLGWEAPVWRGKLRGAAAFAPYEFHPLKFQLDIFQEMLPLLAWAVIIAGKWKRRSSASVLFAAQIQNLLRKLLALEKKLAAPDGPPYCCGCSGHNRPLEAIFDDIAAALQRLSGPAAQCRAVLEERGLAVGLIERLREGAQPGPSSSLLLKPVFPSFGFALVPLPYSGQAVLEAALFPASSSSSGWVACTEALLYVFLCCGTEPVADYAVRFRDDAFARMLLLGRAAAMLRKVNSTAAGLLAGKCVSCSDLYSVGSESLLLADAGQARERAPAVCAVMARLSECAEEDDIAPSALTGAWLDEVWPELLSGLRLVLRSD